MYCIVFYVVVNVDYKFSILNFVFFFFVFIVFDVLYDDLYLNVLVFDLLFFLERILY